MVNAILRCSNKNVLFVTTKQLSYIRNNQELNLLVQNANSVLIAGSNNKSYIMRILSAYILSIFYCMLKKIDVVFVGFAPQLMYPLFWLYKLQKRPLVIDFFISLYDTFVCDRKKFSSNNLIAKFMHWLDCKTIQSVNFYITDTKAHKEYFVSEFSASNDKGETLYLKANTDIYHKKDIQRPSYLKNKYLVLYFGSILPLQGVEIILKAIRKMRAYSDIHFIMIGPIDKKYNKPQTDNVTYFEWLNEEQLADYIEMADLCLAGHFSSTIGKANRTIPGKVYIYKAMNKKVVFGDSSANRELFVENDENIFVARGDAKALAKCIYNMYLKEYGVKDESFIYRSSI